MHVNSYHHEGFGDSAIMYLLPSPSGYRKSKIPVRNKRKCRIHPSVRVMPATAER